VTGSPGHRRAHSVAYHPILVTSATTDASVRWRLPGPGAISVFRKQDVSTDGAIDAYGRKAYDAIVRKALIVVGSGSTQAVTRSMDISFTCDKCGKILVIDEAGAGITIDCPQCGKAVYVPSTTPPKPKEVPVRVEPKPLTRVATPPPSPASPPRNNPLVPSYPGQQKSVVHPSIEAGVHCLLILIAIEIVGFLAARQNILWAGVFFYASTPFVLAPLLCAVYGMCVGHVRDGLLLLAGLALIIGLSCWFIFSPFVQMGGGGMQQLMKQFLR